MPQVGLAISLTCSTGCWSDQVGVVVMPKPFIQKVTDSYSA
jgi:hypothetical protein